MELKTKKQKMLEKKLKHMGTQVYAKAQAKKLLNQKDKEWRELVKAEFDNKCIICGRTDIIHAHHLFPREIKQFRHEVLNGVTLCPLHHKYSIEISAHKNPIMFLNYYSSNFKERFEKLKQMI